MPKITRAVGAHVAAQAMRSAVIAAFALGLGACDKCAMPVWQPNTPAQAPLSCHGDAPAPR
jgi:hypothetical protein